MRKKRNIVLALVIGFIIAMILMSVSIYLGYRYAYSSEVEQYTVKLLGISIYELTRTGESYSGVTIGPNMGMICGIGMVVSFAVEKIAKFIMNRTH